GPTAGGPVAAGASVGRGTAAQAVRSAPAPTANVRPRNGRRPIGPLADIAAPPSAVFSGHRVRQPRGGGVPGGAPTSGSGEDAVVLYVGRAVDEVAEVAAPLWEERAVAEALHVVGDRVPLDVQDEALGVLDAALEAAAAVALRLRDDR